MTSAPALFSPLPPWPFGDLRPHWHNLIAADPPWRFTLRSEKGQAKSAGAQYSTMTLDEIMAMPVGDLAGTNCLLLLWACAPLVDAAFDTVDAWGFTFKSLIVWDKRTKNGKKAWSTGYRVRGRVELVLLATRGNPYHEPFPGEFEGVAREHSRKPEEFYDLVDEKCPGLGRRVDLFARQRRPGWYSWGNEADKFAPAETPLLEGAAA